MGVGSSSTLAVISAFGAQQELQLLALLVSAAALLILAGPLRIPYPILLVVGGLLLGFAPGVPKVTMPPDVVLIGILPPLLYVSAYFTGLRELRQNLRPISLLAVGLVAMTTVGVAVVAHAIADLPWAQAFVLGAVVSPTDPIAAVFASTHLAASATTDAAAKIAVLTAMIVLINATWLIAGASFAHLLRDPLRARLINITLAATLVGATAFAVLH